MSKTEIREWLTLSAVAVGLVFVGLELRQNTLVQRITATQTLAAQYSDALEVMAYEPCTFVLGSNALDNLDEAGRLRFFVIMFEIMRAGEELHYYSGKGMVEPRIWRGFERQLADLASLHGVQEWWTVRHHWFSDDFQAFVDALIAAARPVPGAQLEYAPDSCPSRDDTRSGSDGS